MSGFMIEPPGPTLGRTVAGQYGNRVTARETRSGPLGDSLLGAANTDECAPMQWLLCLAGLTGAAGIALTAAAAHMPASLRLDTAGYLLLLHAAATVATCAAAERGLLWRPLAIMAASSFIAGSALFATDLALRAFAQVRLFPLAAPTGGMILIVGWLAIAPAAVVALSRP